MTDMYEPSTVVYTLNATLEISPGSNLTTNFTAYDIIETSPDKWHMYGIYFFINIDGYMCSLNDENNCTVEIPELSKNMEELYNVIGDTSSVYFSPPKGVFAYKSWIKLPAFFRGASFDKISKYDFYAYSKFENGVSVVNITAFNRTVNVHTSCAGTTPGIDWKYVPNNGACDHLQASIQVMNASGDVLTQDSGCIKYNYFDSGSYLYQNVDFQKVINVFPTAKTHQFLNCLTYNTQYNDEGSIKITNIPSNEPIFWLLDYTITDSFNDLLAETSGAIPLVLLCNSTSNCTYAKDIQFYIYDQPNSPLYNSPYSTNKTIHVGCINECNLPKLNATIELRCSNDENCPINATSTTTTTTSTGTSQSGYSKTQSTTIKTSSKSYTTHMPDTNTTPNAASYSKQISLLAINFMIIFISTNFK